jgi:hypothetical protein
MPKIPSTRSGKGTSLLFTSTGLGLERLILGRGAAEGLGEFGTWLCRSLVNALLIMA